MTEETDIQTSEHKPVAAAAVGSPLLECSPLELSQACFMEWIKELEYELVNALSGFDAMVRAGEVRDTDAAGLALNKAWEHTLSALKRVRFATQAGGTPEGVARRIEQIQKENNQGVPTCANKE